MTDIFYSSIGAAMGLKVTDTLQHNDYRAIARHYANVYGSHSIQSTNCVFAHLVAGEQIDDVDAVFRIATRHFMTYLVAFVCDTPALAERVGQAICEMIDNDHDLGVWTPLRFGPQSKYVAFMRT